MDLELFAKRIRVLREAKGWSREHFGELAEVTYHQVVKWELARQGTTVKRLATIYDVFGVTPEQFWDPDYIPGELPLDKKASTTPVIDAGVPKVDDDGRVIVCPRCKNDEHSDIAIHCSSCGLPLYNMCSGDDRHKNVPTARFCELCGARTYWNMDEAELQKHGVPPLD